MTKTIKEEQLKKKQFYCEHCSKYILGGSYKFNAHLHLHEAVNPRYKCSYCLKSYYRHDMYVKHMNSHRNLNIPKKIYVCDYCNREYIDKRNLIKHLGIHEGRTASNFTRFKCEACEANFCENRILVNHIRRVHFNHTGNNEPLHTKRSVNESWFENVVQTDTCVQITKLNNNTISIKKCGKIKSENLDTKENVDNKDHYRFVSDNYTLYSRAICDYCNKEMLKKSLINHIREKHLNVKRFKCNVCNRSYHRSYQLVHHNCDKVRRRKHPKSVLVTLKLKDNE